MKCKIDGCEKDVRHNGLCTTHYKRQWRHGNSLTTNTPTRGFERLECVVEGCLEVADYGNGMCALHYQRNNRYGRTHNVVGERGSGTINASGYIVYTVDSKSVYEHVLLAEQALGRKLPKGAVVHHMNNKPWDNYTPLNLVICPDQAYHMLLHRRMKELGYENS